MLLEGNLEAAQRVFNIWKAAHAEVPDRKLICPDRNKRTSGGGVSSVQNQIWKNKWTHDSLDIGNFDRTIVWT